LLSPSGNFCCLPRSLWLGTKMPILCQFYAHCALTYIPQNSQSIESRRCLSSTPNDTTSGRRSREPSPSKMVQSISYPMQLAITRLQRAPSPLQRICRALSLGRMARNHSWPGGCRGLWDHSYCPILQFKSSPDSVMMPQVISSWPLSVDGSQTRVRKEIDRLVLCE
jgi:hypothetical protein